MTDREYELLDFIRLKGPVKWFKVLNAFGPVTEGQNNNAVLEQALVDELIQSIHPQERRYRRTIRITTKGILALLAAEEQMQREASVRAGDIREKKNQERSCLNQTSAEGNDQQSEKKADRIFQIALAVLPPFITEVVPIIIEWITSIF